MKNTETNKRPRIGFRYWNNDQEDFIEETPTLEGIGQINTMNSSEEQVTITPTHNEVLVRLEMVENIILGKAYSTMSKKKKLEYLSEQNFLKGLNEQLIKSY